MNKKEIEQERVRREKLRDANNLEDISIADKLDIMRNIIHLEGLSNSQEIKEAHDVLRSKLEVKKQVTEENECIREEKFKLLNKDKVTLKKYLNKTELLATSNFTVAQTNAKKQDIIFQTIKRADKKKYEVSERMKLLKELTTRLNDLKTATLCIPHGYEEVKERMKIFENLVEDSYQKNQTIKVLSYMYKKIIIELKEELKNIPHKLEKLEKTVNLNMKRIPILMEMQKMAEKDIQMISDEQEIMEKDEIRQKKIRDKLFRLRNKQLEEMRMAKYDVKMDKKRKKSNYPQMQQSQNSSKLKKMRDTRLKKKLGCKSKFKNIKKSKTAQNSIDPELEELDMKEIIRRLLFKQGMFSLISEAARVSNIEDISPKFDRLGIMEAKLLEKIAITEKEVKRLGEEKERLKSRYECEKFRDRFGIRARQINICAQKKPISRCSLEAKRAEQEREIHCLTSELFQIKQGINTVLYKAGEFTGSKLSNLENNTVNESANMLLERCELLKSRFDDEGIRNLEDFMIYDDKFGHRVDEFENCVDCVIQNGRIFVNIDETEKPIVKEYDFDTPDDPNCFSMVKLKKENEKYTQKCIRQRHLVEKRTPHQGIRR